MQSLLKKEPPHQEEIDIGEINYINQNFFIAKRILKEQVMRLYFDIENARLFRNIYYNMLEILRNPYNGCAFFDSPNNLYGNMHVLNSFILYNYGPYHLSINILMFAFSDSENGDFLIKDLIESATRRESKIHAVFHTDEIKAIEICKRNGFISKRIINSNSFDYEELEFS